MPKKAAVDQRKAFRDVVKCLRKGRDSEMWSLTSAQLRPDFKENERKICWRQARCKHFKKGCHNVYGCMDCNKWKQKKK